MRILDLGCGNTKADGAVGFDIVALTDVDVVGNVNKPLPFHDSTFDRVICRSVLEHVDDVIAVMGEIHRVLAENGQLFIHVPFFRRNTAYKDPQHKHFFTHGSMNYFLEGYRYSYYSNFKFRLLSKKIIFPRRHYIFPFAMYLFANQFPDFYENYVSALVPATNIRWLLQKI